jgi:predicted ATP-dependent endonuclease of OLD family
MKVEFNPKVTGDRRNTIYLLDEPGSYLHPFAQNKLCKKLLDISKNNKVIYCTHTHYLLDPDIIPLNTIHISSKNDYGKITLEKCNTYSNPSKGIQSAFQPIFDALYLKPFSLDFTFKKMLLVEGIYDYYAFSLFKTNNDFGIIPGKNADSLINLISIMIGFNIDFKVLWDKDEEGEKKFDLAEKHFGSELAAKHFFLLGKLSNKNVIIQNLFDGKDMKLIKEMLQISSTSSFEKTISSLYYYREKQEILNMISTKTKDNFKEIFERLSLS